jgi:hypothetical protein
VRPEADVEVRTEYGVIISWIIDNLKKTYESGNKPVLMRDSEEVRDFFKK